MKKTSRNPKKEIREKTHLVRPPRLEAVVSKAKLRKEKKKRRPPTNKPGPKKPQSYTAKQRKDYQLRSKRKHS